MAGNSPEGTGRDARWGDEIILPKGLVQNAKRILFRENEGDEGQTEKKIGNKRESKGSREETNNPEARERLVDHSSIEDLSLLLNRFGGGGKVKTLESRIPRVSENGVPPSTAAKIATHDNSLQDSLSLAHYPMNDHILHQSSSQVSLDSVNWKGDVQVTPSPEKRHATTQTTSSAAVASREYDQDASSQNSKVPPPPPPPRGAKVEQGRRHRSVDTIINDNLGKTLPGRTSGGGDDKGKGTQTSQYKLSEYYPTVTSSLRKQVSGNQNNKVALQTALRSTNTSDGNSGMGSTFHGIGPVSPPSSNAINDSGSSTAISRKIGEIFQSESASASAPSRSSYFHGHNAHASIAPSIATTKEPNSIHSKQIFALDPPKKKQPLRPPPPPPVRRRSMPSIAIAAGYSAGNTGANRGGGGGGILRTVKIDKEEKVRSNKSDNKNHRYDNVITEKQRKRYESVWAANRGLISSHTSTFTSNFNSNSGTNVSDSDLVEGIIVRDIFSRSRLNFGALAEIWDLVDRGKKGKLDSEEFVVGMWLIDGCLAGRKVPSRVAEEVWRCVRGSRRDVRL